MAGRPAKITLSAKSHRSTKEREKRGRILELWKETAIQDIKPPSTMKPDAKKEFNKVVAVLQKQHLLTFNDMDVSGLIMYAELIAQYKRLSKQLNRMDDKFDKISRKHKKTDDEKDFYKNYFKNSSLLRSEMRKTVENFLSVCDKFNLTPQGRLKMGLKVAEKEAKNPVESLLIRMKEQKTLTEVPEQKPTEIVIDATAQEQIRDEKTTEEDGNKESTAQNI